MNENKKLGVDREADKRRFFAFKAKFEEAGWQHTSSVMADESTKCEGYGLHYRLGKRTFWLNNATEKSGAAVRALAYGLGYLAFKLGLQRLPASDARLADMCGDDAGQNTILAFNWEGGWDNAKIEQGVPAGMEKVYAAAHRRQARGIARDLGSKAYLRGAERHPVEDKSFMDLCAMTHAAAHLTPEGLSGWDAAQSEK